MYSKTSTFRLYKNYSSYQILTSILTQTLNKANISKVCLFLRTIETIENYYYFMLFRGRVNERTKIASK